MIAIVAVTHHQTLVYFDIVTLYCALLGGCARISGDSDSDRIVTRMGLGRTRTDSDVARLHGGDVLEEVAHNHLGQ